MINASNFPETCLHPVYKYLVDLKPIDYHRSDKSINRQVRASAERLSAYLNKRPDIRTRKTGPVGPELDWSIIYSDVPVDLIRGPWNAGARSHGRYDIFPFLDRNDPCYQQSTKCTLAKHRCCPTFAMRPVHVAAWTKFAMENGIHFHGTRGYVRSKQPEYTDANRQSYFLELRKEGLTTRHRRSSHSRIVRAARRGKRDCLIQSRPADNLFCTRYRLSASMCRDAWFTYRQAGGSLDFKSYRSDHVGRGITLFPPRCHGIIPNIVFKSLKRIYSRPTKVVQGKLWFKPDADLKEVLEIRQPPRQRPLTFLRKGALVLSHKFSSEYDTLRSTIPRASESMDLDWSDDTDLMGRRHALVKRDILLDW